MAPLEETVIPCGAAIYGSTKVLKIQPLLYGEDSMIHIMIELMLEQRLLRGPSEAVELELEVQVKC